MAITVLPLDATSGAPAFTAQQTRDAFSAFLGVAPAGRPLGATSGVRQGTPASTAFLSGAGSTTWNLAAHSGVLDVESPAAAGPYLYATTGSDSGTITAANASNPRIDILYVQVNDNVQDGSGLTDGVVGYLAGAPASTPVAPATPARSMVLATIAVPTAGSGNPSVSWIAPTFYPTGKLTQIGTATISGTTVASFQTASVNVTFPVPYSVTPAASADITGFVSGSSVLVIKQLTITPTAVSISVANVGPSTISWTNLPVCWTAVGTP